MRCRLLALPLVLTATAIGPPAPAASGFEPVGSGATTIALAPSFDATLRRAGVTLVGLGGVRVEGHRISFPVSGGRLDPVSAHGIVEHGGSLVFAAGRRRVPLRGLVFKPTQVRSPLAAKFGGGKLKIASSSRLTVRRAGFGLRARIADIRLSGKVSTRLGKNLRLHGVFGEGLLLGNATTVVQPASVVVLPQERATLAPAPSFLAKLRELFVSLNPISPAELAPGPHFTFPILGGSLAPDGSTGALTFGGSLEFLQLGGGQIFWAQPSLDFGASLASAEVDFEPSPPHPGKEGLMAILGLDPGIAAADPTARTISVGDRSLTLTAATAAAFNEAFAEPQGKSNVFVPGEELGAITFTAHGQ